MPWLDWSNSLDKPSWTPAPATIGLIWQILYPIILISFGFVFTQAVRRKVSWFSVSQISMQRDTVSCQPKRDTENANNKALNHYGLRLSEVEAGGCQLNFLWRGWPVGTPQSCTDWMVTSSRNRR